MHKTKRILIIKLGAIGDVVMALPLLQRIKEKDPNAKIDWLVGKGAYPLLKNIVGIDRLYVIEEEALLRGSLFAKMQELFKAWRLFAFKAYDEIYLLHMDPRYKLLSMWTKGEKKALSKTQGRPSFIPGRYHGSEYVRLIEGSDGHKKMPLTFPALKKETSNALSVALEALGEKFVLLCPGGNPLIEPGKELRRWPLANYVELAKRLMLSPFKVGLIGSNFDRPIVDAFVKSDHLIDLMGQLELHDLPLLMRKAKAVVSHDSGPMHFAVLANAPLIALFGPTLGEEKLPLVYPEYQKRIRLHSGGENLTCRPCYDGKYYAACDNPLCMKSIDVMTIYQSILELANEKHCPCP